MMNSKSIRLIGCLFALAIQSQIARSQQSGVPPIQGSVLRFDSASQVELKKTKGLLQQQTPFTVELWVRARAAKGGKFPLVGDFVDHRHPSISYPDRAGWMLGIGRTTGGTLSFGARFAGIDTGGSLQVDEGKWFHIAATNEPDGMSFYVNGRRWGEKYAADKIKLKTSPINLHLGTTKSLPTNDGHQVDVGDLRISSNCLYRDDFNPPIRFEKRPDTLVLLDFSHPNDKEIKDLSGHEHHGAIRGAKWLARDADSESMPAQQVVIMGPLGNRHTTPGFVPRFKRWEIRFAAPNSQVYARQLDFFGIELGVIGSDKKSVDYASNLSESKPTTRSDPPGDEKRLYVIRAQGDSSILDQQLLRNVGIETSARTVMHFFPPQLENQLAALEKSYGERENRTVQEIVKTVFEIKSRRGGRWQMEIVEMRFRPSPN